MSSLIDKNNTDNKLKLILKDLNSADPSKIKSALKSLQVHGNETVIKPIIDVLNSNDDDEVRVSIVTFLADLKDSSVKPEIMSILNDDSFSFVRQDVLSSVWNSKIDYSEYIADFVGLGCQGNFLEAFECLTIIENLEGPFEERHLLECQLHFKDYYSNNEAKEPQKAQIISDLATLIKGFELITDEDDFNLDLED